MAMSAATNHAIVLPAKLQNASASNAPDMKMILRAVQYFRLMRLRNSPRRLKRVICFSSCSNRVIRVEHNPFPSNQQRCSEQRGQAPFLTCSLFRFFVPLWCLLLHAQGGVGHSESCKAGAVVCSRPKVVMRITEPIITPAATNI